MVERQGGLGYGGKNEFGDLADASPFSCTIWEILNSEFQGP